MPQNFTLEGLAGGAISEQINMALYQVLQNIVDPNTEWKTKRKLAITLTLAPDENRELAEVNVQVKPTMASAKPTTTRIIIDRDSTGKIVSAEYRKGVPGQVVMNVDKETGEIDTALPSGLKVIK